MSSPIGRASVGPTRVCDAAQSERLCAVLGVGDDATTEDEPSRSGDREEATDPGDPEPSEGGP